MQTWTPDPPHLLQPGLDSHFAFLSLELGSREQNAHGEQNFSYWRGSTHPVFWPVVHPPPRMALNGDCLPSVVRYPALSCMLPAKPPALPPPLAMPLGGVRGGRKRIALHGMGRLPADFRRGCSSGQAVEGGSSMQQAVICTCSEEQEAHTPWPLAE